MRKAVWHISMYRYSKELIKPYIGNFSRGFNFRWVRDLPEIAKNRHSKNNPYDTSSLRFLEIAKIGLSENLTHIPRVIFVKISRLEKFPIYGNINYVHNDSTCQHYMLYCCTLPFQRDRETIAQLIDENIKSSMISNGIVSTPEVTANAWHSETACSTEQT